MRRAALRCALPSLRRALTRCYSHADLIHHTDCGLSKFDTPSLLRRARASLGWLGAARLLGYGPPPTFKADELDASVRDDVAALAHARVLLSGTPIVGLVFDTHTGRLREVARAVHK